MVIIARYCQAKALAWQRSRYGHNLIAIGYLVQAEHSPLPEAQWLLLDLLLCYCAIQN